MPNLKKILKRSNKKQLLTISAILFASLIFSAVATYFILNSLSDPTPNPPIPNDTNSKQQSVDISTQEMQSYSQHAYQVLDSYFEENIDSDNTSEIDDIPNFNSYEKLFITVLVNNQIRCCKSGSSPRNSSNRFSDDIEQGVIACIEDDRFGGVLEESEIANAKIVFNIFHNKSQITDNSTLYNLEQNIELGIHAIEINQNDESTYFKESVPITKNYDLEYTFNRLCLKNDWSQDCYLDPATEIYIYDTFSFLSNRENQISELYRYNIYLPLEEVNENLIKERLNLTLNWFVNNTNTETNLFEYMYLPSEDTYSQDNNHVRALASIWAASKLQNYLDKNSLDTQISTTLSHYLNNYTNCDPTLNECYIEIDGQAKLGYSAFAILALLETEEIPDRFSRIESIKNAIIAKQNEDGSYSPYFNTDTESGTKYYPGEAMLALMQLYETTNDQTILQSVEKAFPYYEKYWRENKNTAMISWHTRADYLLYTNTKDEELKQDIKSFVFEINDWLIDNNQVTQSPYKDEIGGFGSGTPSAVSTATYTEGLNDAYRLALEANDTKHQKKYATSVNSALRFILQNQYTPENSFYLKKPQRAIGGFRRSLISNKQRIDYQQHSAFALIKALENGVVEEKD